MLQVPFNHYDASGLSVGLGQLPTRYGPVALVLELVQAGSPAIPTRRSARDIRAGSGRVWQHVVADFVCDEFAARVTGMKPCRHRSFACAYLRVLEWWHQERVIDIVRRGRTCP